MWQERADYGHFFYRIPNGESAADAYDRVSGFNESLWRQFGEDDFASVCVLVTHGLMSRVFLMKWYHFTVEYFEDLRNVDHCEFLIMRKEDNGKYTLDTKLRTWSDLRRDKALKNKERDPNATDEDTKLPRNKTFVVTRRWGGCPNGCSHTNHYKKRQDLDALRQRETERAAESSRSAASSTHPRRRRANLQLGLDPDEQEDNDQDGGTRKGSTTAANSTPKSPPVVAVAGTTRTVERILPPPSDDDPAISPITKSPQYTHLGRDFGASYSGHTSIAGSDSDSNDEEASRQRSTTISSLNDALHPDSRVHHDRHHSRTLSASSTGSMAHSGPGPFVNRLGDAPAMGMSDSENEPARQKMNGSGVNGCGKGDGKEEAEEDLDAAEAADRSIRGSVY